MRKKNIGLDKYRNLMGNVGSQGVKKFVKSHWYYKWRRSNRWTDIWMYISQSYRNLPYKLKTLEVFSLRWDDDETTTIMKDFSDISATE